MLHNHPTGGLKCLVIKVNTSPVAWAYAETFVSLKARSNAVLTSSMGKTFAKGHQSMHTITVNFISSWLCKFESAVRGRRDIKKHVVQNMEPCIWKDRTFQCLTTLFSSLQNNMWSFAYTVTLLIKFIIYIWIMDADIQTTWRTTWTTWNLELNIREQNDIDTTYQELLDIIYDEMNSQLQYKDYTPGTKSRRKYSKPYWNDDLQLLWTKTRDAEKKYLKWRGDNTQRNYLRRRFLEHRKHFDKELRLTKRWDNALQRDHIQQLRTDDPKGFWDAIRKLGPGNATHLNTDKVKLDHGSTSMDPKLVMAKWKTDFEALYQRCNSPDNSVDNNFLEHLERQTAEWEEQFQAATTGQGPPRSDLEEDIYLASLQLNASITLQETINALKQCKNGKATGIDNIRTKYWKWEPYNKHCINYSVPALKPAKHHQCAVPLMTFPRFFLHWVSLQ